MVLVCVAVWLIVKRWWLGSLIAGLVAVAWVIPSLSHLTGAQRGQALGALLLAFAMYGGFTAALYGLRHGLVAAWRAVRRPTAPAR